ncbi:Mucin-21 [Xylographa pallens]|nr:Mucin-21 [Xylographa pallens]
MPQVTGSMYIPGFWEIGSIYLTGDPTAGFQVDGTTISPSGRPVTLSGLTLALGHSGQVIVNGKTTAVSTVTWPGGGPQPTVTALITKAVVSGNVVLCVPYYVSKGPSSTITSCEGDWVTTVTGAAARTIAPPSRKSSGKATNTAQEGTTNGGTSPSGKPSGTATNTVKGETSKGATSRTAALNTSGSPLGSTLRSASSSGRGGGGTGQVPLIIGSLTVTANPSGFTIGSQTVLPGAPAITAAGHTISLGSSGTLIEDGSTQIIGSTKANSRPTPIGTVASGSSGPKASISGTQKSGPPPSGTLNTKGTQLGIPQGSTGSHALTGAPASTRGGVTVPSGSQITANPEPSIATVTESSTTMTLYQQTFANLKSLTAPTTLQTLVTETDSAGHTFTTSASIIVGSSGVWYRGGGGLGPVIGPPGLPLIQFGGLPCIIPFLCGNSGNSPGGNSPGGNNPGGNNPGRSTPGVNNPTGNNPEPSGSPSNSQSTPKSTTQSSTTCTQNTVTDYSVSCATAGSTKSCVSKSVLRTGCKATATATTTNGGTTGIAITITDLFLGPQTMDASYSSNFAAAGSYLEAQYSSLGIIDDTEDVGTTGSGTITARTGTSTLSQPSASGSCPMTTPKALIPGCFGTPGCAYVAVSDVGAADAACQADYCNCGGTIALLLTKTISGKTTQNCAYTTQPQTNQCPLALSTGKGASTKDVSTGNAPSTNSAASKVTSPTAIVPQPTWQPPPSPSAGTIGGPCQSSTDCRCQSGTPTCEAPGIGQGAGICSCT